MDQLSGHGAVIIYASANLANWFPKFTNPPLTGALQFQDAAATTNATRFYRAAEQ